MVYTDVSMGPERISNKFYIHPDEGLGAKSEALLQVGEDIGQHRPQRRDRLSTPAQALLHHLHRRPALTPTLLKTLYQAGLIATLQEQCGKRILQ